MSTSREIFEYERQLLARRREQLEPVLREKILKTLGPLLPSVTMRFQWPEPPTWPEAWESLHWQLVVCDLPRTQADLQILFPNQTRRLIIMGDRVVLE